MSYKRICIQMANTFFTITFFSLCPQFSGLLAYLGKTSYCKGLSKWCDSLPVENTIERIYAGPSGRAV